MSNPIECRTCVNTTANPAVRIGKGGRCGTCAAFRKRFDPARLARERAFLKRLIRRDPRALVGLSGGKDSTATLIRARRFGFDPTAFTFDLGYYPPGIFRRAARVARHLGVPHERIDIRPYARPSDLRSYRLTAALYDAPETPELAAAFRQAYARGRRHYSANCAHALAFVRSCQLCRRIVIRAYCAEALKRGVRVVILGMNEWAGLSGGRFGAIRRLKPYRDAPAVYVVHLPFLFRTRLGDTRRILASIGWTPPSGERVVESNANSCLFARAAEAKAKRLLGFHPDATRLSREVTAGFLTKAQAKRALEKAHRSRLAVRQVLQKAGLA